MIKASTFQKENTFIEKLAKSQEIISQKQNINLKSAKKFGNNGIQPTSLYNSFISPNQANKEFSVKMVNSFKGKLDINNIIQSSPLNQNINKKLFSSQNLTNSYSDLCTSASFSSQKSTESFFPNKNVSQFTPNKLFLLPNNLNIFNTQRKIVSTEKINNEVNNNIFYNSTLKSLTNNINNNNVINQKLNQNLDLINLKNPNYLIKEKPISNFNYNNIFCNNTINNKQKNYFDTQKSINFGEQNSYLINNETINIDSINIQNTNNINGSTKNGGFQNNNLENTGRKKSKNFYNKFNSSKENNMNENTVILTLKIKVGKNDYRIFNLKKYDDLFVSIEKFLDINKINQDLVKPLITKIFMTLNKIFWLLNNKIGLYDQEYLLSLYKLWIKNNKEIPKSRNKNPSDKSTTSSSESSNESSYKDIKSNSYQNSDGNSSDGKERQHTSKSF